MALSRPSWGWWGLALAVLLTAAPAAAPQSNSPAPPANASSAKPKPPAEAQAPAPAPTKAQDDRIEIENADDYSYDPATKMHYLRGRVVVKTRDVRLTCDAADYNDDADTMKASGNLKVVDKNGTLTGDLLEADFNQELMIFTGHVQVLAQKRAASQKLRTAEEPATALVRDKPQTQTPGAPADGRNRPGQAAEPNTPAKGPGKGQTIPFKEYEYRKTLITCERVEYYYADDQKRMIATPRVKAVQEKRTVFADQAVFEDIARTVTLTGNVLIQTQDGDELHCAKAVISLDDEWVKAEKVSGITPRKRNQPAAPAAPAAPPASGQPAAPPVSPPAPPQPPA